MKQLQHFIGGEWQQPTSREYLENMEPAKGKLLNKIASGNKEDVALAVEKARAAFPAWSGLSAEQRSQYMLDLADAIEERLEDFAKAESQDTGKPVWLARKVDIPRACANLRFFAKGVTQWESVSHEMPGAINYTLRHPLGVVGCISPWNLPLYLFTWKVAPALATGNCVIAKPSELTPTTATMMAELMQELNWPAGVFNLLHGLGPRVGQAIIEHPEIKAISFTGGTATGRKIAATAAPMFKKLSLELGGKNPTIIFAKANLEEAVTNAVRASFTNQGEICLCGSRILIEASVYDQVRDLLVEKVKKLKVGDPAGADTKVGALVSAGHRQKVLDYIQLAQEEGGAILCGGGPQRMEGELAEGYYVQPTLIEGLAPTCRTNQEEIFGPVATLMPFETEEEAIQIANGTEYGLAANIWTEDLRQAHRVSAALEFGIVWVNCWMMRDLRTPFGGVKNSGVGREGGTYALDFFTEPKNVCIKY